MMAETFVRQRPVKAVQGIPASGTPFAACELRAALTGRPLLVFRVFHEAGLAEAGLQVFPFHAPFG